MTTQTLYKVIGFGENSNGFFNQFACFSSLKYACRFYDTHLQDPEYSGSVIIKCQHETWEVILEFGTEGYSVECEHGFTHKVTKSLELVMV